MLLFYVFLGLKYFFFLFLKTVLFTSPIILLPWLADDVTIKITLAKTPLNNPKKRNLNQKINYSKSRICSFLFSFQIFQQKVSNPTKLAKKDYSFYKIVSLNKPHSFDEPQLTQHCKKYNPATEPKTLLTLQIFPQTFFWLVS